MTKQKQRRQDQGLQHEKWGPVGGAHSADVGRGGLSEEVACMKSGVAMRMLGEPFPREKGWQCHNLKAGIVGSFREQQKDSGR